MHRNGCKRARQKGETSKTEQLEEDGHHYKELLALFKALEQKDAEKSAEIVGLKALLKEAKDELKTLNEKVVALKTFLQFTQMSTTFHYVVSIGWARNNQDLSLYSSLAEPTEIMFGASAIIWKDLISG